MKIETSTSISSEQVADIKKKLRQAAEESKNENFFPSGEEIEVVNGNQYPAIEDFKKSDSAKPLGDPTACGIAYQLALQYCGGNAICEFIAYEAYQACLRS